VTQTKNFAIKYFAIKHSQYNASIKELTEIRTEFERKLIDIAQKLELEEV